MKEKKIILIISAQYLPHLGGVENYVDNMANTLSSKGHEVVVLTSTKDDTCRFDQNKKFKVYRLSSVGLLKGRFPLFIKDAKYYKICKELNSYNFDAVVINTRFYPLSLWGARYAVKRGLRPIVIEHGSGPLSIGSNRIKNSIIHLGEGYFTRRIIRTNPVFSSVSLSAKNWLKQHCNISSEEEIVYNSVNYDRIDQISKEEINRRGSFFVMYAGRLIEEKGILVLIQAIEELSKKINITLYVAGDGPLVDSITNDNAAIKYLGSLQFEKVIGMIKACDVFCFPSMCLEGFPTAVLEAAACKIPIVGSTGGGTKEILINNKVAYILDTVSKESIANSILEVYHNKENATERAKLLNDYVRKQFNWDITTQALLTIINKYTN